MLFNSIASFKGIDVYKYIFFTYIKNKEEAMKLKFLVILYSLFFSLTIFTFAGKVPKIDDLISLKRAVEVAIWPDGKSIAYVVEVANWEKDQYDREIWLAQKGKKPVALVSGQSSNYSLNWSPDGIFLFFLSNRTGKAQIYRISAEGGEEECLTEVEQGVSSFRMSPTGEWLVLSIQDPESKAFKKRKDIFGDFEWVHEDFRMTHLWRLDLKSKRLERITNGNDFTVDSFSISPDGKKIAFSARPVPSVITGNDSDIYVVETESGKEIKMVDLRGSDVNPLWSPDGKYVAFETSGGKGKVYLNRPIAIVPASGGSVKLVSHVFDANHTLIAWRSEGLYFSAWQKTERYLFRIQPDGSGLERVSGQHSWVLTRISIAQDAGKIAFIGENFDSFAEVYTSPLSAFNPVRLTNFDSQLDNFTLSQRELIRWKSKDGTEIDGILVKPADFSAKKKYPLLFVIHGGHASIDSQQKISKRETRLYPIDRFVARGALVLMVNYRGSAGDGEKFCSLNVRNLGIGDEWDIESGIDYLVELGYVDPDGVGTMGWSQGGFISAFLGHPQPSFQGSIGRSRHL